MGIYWDNGKDMEKWKLLFRGQDLGFRGLGLRACVLGAV